MRKVRFNAGLIVPRKKGRFLFVIRPKDEWQDSGKKKLVGFGFVGGGVKLGETRLAAAERESLEETGIKPAMSNPQKTLLISRRGRQRLFAPKQRPIPSVQLSLDAQRKGEPFLFRTRFYTGKLKGRLKASSEIPALIELTPIQVERLAKRPIRTQTLLKQGARIVSGGLPKNSVLFPVYSAKILGEHFRRIVKS